MNNVLKTIGIELYSPTSYEVVKAQQGDHNSRIIELVLYEQGKEYEITGNISFWFTGYRGNGSAFFREDCIKTTEDNRIIITLTNDILYYPGTIEAKIVMYDTPNHSVLSTIPFQIVCKKTPCHESSLTQSEKSIITDLIFKVEESSQAAAEILKGAVESATSAANSAHSAKSSEEIAGEYKNTSIESASNAANSANTASEKAAAASTSAQNAEDSSLVSKSYAVGEGDVRENESVDNAKYYYEQAKRISQGLKGSLLPMGTISFSQLNAQTKQAGYMYNISNNFVTDETFKEGSGHAYPPGTNVYYTADGYWDCLAGVMVTSVNGENGDVLITPENIGALPNTMEQTINNAYERANKAYDAIYDENLSLGRNASVYGTYSTALGGYSYASGNDSTALGYSANASNYGGTAIGSSAHTSDIYSTAVGIGAAASMNDSTALGSYANAFSYSTALGSYANAFSYSTALGCNSNSANSSVALGGNSNAANSSVALGIGAKATGINSTALGYIANATGNYSTALGYSATVNGFRTTALGSYASASGNNSIALGYGTKATGENSIALGHQANVNKINSTALGSYASATGINSTALGSSASASGNNSTALGRHTWANGIGSIALGYNAQATGINSTALGYSANAQSNYSTALGYYATIAAANTNTIQLGNASSLSTLSCRVALSVTSDERDKADIAEIEDGALEFLNKIHAIRYVFNHRELYIDEETLPKEEKEKKEKFGLCEYDKEAHEKGTKKGSRMRVGVSAQEVQKALEEIYGDSSYANLINDNLFDINPEDIPEGVENQLTANYEGFIPFLIKAVQELSQQLSKKTALIDELNVRMQILEKRKSTTESPEESDAND